MPNPLAFLAARRPGIALVPTVAWPRRGERPSLRARTMRCPNCGSDAVKALALWVRWKIVTDPVRRMALLDCPACGCRFFERQKLPDYTEPSLMERGRVPFYLQQGAGVSLITSPLARIERPPGSTYLEVGCGFGFGVDFAAAARGWVARGIDPAPLAGLGRTLLGIDIAQRYLEPADAAGIAADVVMASETIEHVPSPRGFLHVLRWALRPGGILALTTPDAGQIVPATPAGTLVPMLSPGLHTVLQTEASLRALLTEAGFTHVHIAADGCSLVAYASDAPFTLTDDPATLRGRYRGYLETRATSADKGGDLFLGMAGRALCEAVSDGDMAAAAAAWALLAPVCRARFETDLDGPAPLPAEARGCPLERMAAIMPLNLAGVLYARAMLRMAQGAARADVEAQFAAASEAASVLRRALNDIAIDDLQTADLAWVARAEAVLCAADRGAPDIVARVAALSDAPDEPVRGARRGAIVARALTGLVNHSHYALGEALAGAERLRDAVWPGELDAARRDALFSLGVLDLYQTGQAQRAAGAFDRVLASLRGLPDGQGLPLYQAALGGATEAARLREMADHGAA